MRFKKKLEEVLSEIESTLNIPNSYLERDSKTTECIVYTYTEFLNEFSDGIETSTKYDLYVNLILVENLIVTTEKVASIFKKHKFKKVVINIPQKIEINKCKAYETTMNFKIIIESED